jgi:DNA-binding PadR family transcriptional regulator
MQYIRNGYIHDGWNMTKKAPEETPDPQQYLPLTPAVFHIMLALAGGQGHGYGIMLEVERLTSGRLNLGPGTLYRSIQRMLVDGLVDETTDAQESEEDDERRRYYRLTPLGLLVARAEAQRLESLVNAARERELLPQVKGSRS